MKKEKEKYNLYVKYEENSTGGEPESDDPWSTLSPTYITVEWKNAYIENPNQLYVERTEINFNPEDLKYVYILVVIYSDGNTFGHSYGNNCLIGAYKSIEKTQKIKKTIEKNKYKGYKPWEGYFAELTDIEIIKVNLIK